MNEERYNKISEQSKAFREMARAVFRLSHNNHSAIFMAEAAKQIDAVGGKELAIAYLIGAGYEPEVIMSVQSL